jgi:hypothetical protein
VRAHPDTLLNKLVDVLYSFDRRIGEYLRCAPIPTPAAPRGAVLTRPRSASPSHYIVIENIAAEKTDGWELFDLKPPDYLEPFRDLVPERVQLSGVTDILPKDKTVLLPAAERADLLRRLRADLAFLAALGCVDYSVLLVCPPGGARPRLALIDVFWSLREPRALLTKAASDAGALGALRAVRARSLTDWRAQCASRSRRSRPTRTGTRRPCSRWSRAACARRRRMRRSRPSARTSCSSTCEAGAHAVLALRVYAMCFASYVVGVVSQGAWELSTRASGTLKGFDRTLELHAGRPGCIRASAPATVVMRSPALFALLTALWPAHTFTCPCPCVLDVTGVCVHASTDVSRLAVLHAPPPAALANVPERFCHPAAVLGRPASALRSPLSRAACLGTRSARGTHQTHGRRGMRA